MHNRPNILVDLPEEKGIFLKKCGSLEAKYVYKRLNYYRDSKNRTKSDTVILGTYDSKTNKIIPNKNYYQLYNCVEIGNSINLENYGYIYVVNKCIKELHLDECLISVFGDMADDIIILATYILTNGNVIDGLDNWLLHAYHNKTKLTSKTASTVFANISYEDQFNFFKNWAKQASSGASVC